MHNPHIQSYNFLAAMAEDSYYPAFLVAQGQQILVNLCETIEAQKPVDAAALVALTHAATEAFNQLEAEFDANGSEFDTVARETIASDFAFIVSAYGFDGLDLEAAIAPREW